MNSKFADMKELCDLYEKRLFHIAYRITRDHHIAQDVVQEAFVKAYLKMDSLQDQEKVLPWLSAITTRTAIDFVRKERKTKERTDSIEDWEKSKIIMNQNVEEEVEVNILQEKINRFLDSMSADQKNVYLLKIKHGLKEREIAELLRLNPNTVKTKLYRIRKQLKDVVLQTELA
ncbi:RNA polymerase sigma factor [Cytobacillus purgationiresistens]|uniref:RNA polymerase sigma factor n=1 Tax=Cytobacillus purgationiresistens TaxID=863449 RepID=A0ABU0AM14_9BACI|nr:sigma-70 family RNA polymerase sigma factor [Cytobacillus purgationiresistens]MDQ0272308.1 RNA polymerase sigma-70 factor (ECF subfamily) [Cytobacillus purgationiresistens]